MTDQRVTADNLTLRSGRTPTHTMYAKIAHGRRLSSGSGQYATGLSVKAGTSMFVIGEESRGIESRTIVKLSESRMAFPRAGRPVKQQAARRCPDSKRPQLLHCARRPLTPSAARLQLLVQPPWVTLSSATDLDAR